MGEHHQNSQTVQKNVTKRWNAREKLGTIFHRKKLTRKSPKNLLFVGQCLFIFSQTQGLGRGSIAAIF